jgi:CRISPR-associated protein Cmr5
MTSNPRPTLDQERARYAWECVSKLEKELGDYYINVAKSAPALIMNNGLMQTLAFLQGKDKDHHKALRDHICKWLGRRFGGEPLGGDRRFAAENEADYRRVMESLYNSPSGLYRRATDESLALLRWVRQLAAAHKE